MKKTSIVAIIGILLVSVVAALLLLPKKAATQGSTGAKPTGLDLSGWFKLFGNNSSTPTGATSESTPDSDGSNDYNSSFGYSDYGGSNDTSPDETWT